jgi:translation initiation factor IF-3
MDETGYNQECWRVLLIFIRRRLSLDVLSRSTIRGLSQVRLVGDGYNEIVSASVALARAEDAGLDLVLVGDSSNPPVVRIQDFKKLQYEQKKAKKQTKKTTLKEMQFKVNISDNDFQTKMNAIKNFLSHGDMVKVIVRLKGRERENPERAHALLAKVIASVDCKAKKIPGPIAMVMLEPGSAAKT